MENINGALAYVATLDIDDFNVSAEAMDRHIRQVSTNIQMEADDMEQSLLDFAQKGAMYIQAYLVGHGMTGLLQSIAEVRGQFQQLEIAFGTMLGSEQKAKDLMDQMIQTAAKTPFDLAGVAGGAKQLLAYGTAAEKVNDTLVRLGNIASGLSIPLNDIVYLYGTTMVQGRLYAQDVRQFTGRGIPLVKELARMYGVTADEINNMVSAGKIGFPEVEKVINGMTDAGGQFYNLMEKQSASLTGMLSNLSDSWDSMLNDIGTKNQEVFADAINGASYLVEHYQQILDILEAVAVSYGSLRAAIMLNTLATKGYTGVALLDNTARQAKIALMKAEAVATGQVAAQQRAMTAARETHIQTLEKELTASELLNLQNKVRAKYIEAMLTAQQKEYLSNLGLTTSSQNYEAVAKEVMNVEQQAALKKIDLANKSAIYRVALENEVVAKKKGIEAAKNKAKAEMENLQREQAMALQRFEMAKQQHILSIQKVDDAKYELWQARQNGTAEAVYRAQKRLGIAQDQLAANNKALLAATTDLNAKKQAVEAAAIAQSASASANDVKAKGAQIVATSLLTKTTNAAKGAISLLWQTMKANPLGWIITAFGLVTSAISLFGSKQEEATDLTGEFNNKVGEEMERLNMLQSIIETTDSTTKTHKDAVGKINQMCQEYNITLLDKDQKKLYDELTEAIKRNAKAKTNAKYIEESRNSRTERDNDTFDDLFSDTKSLKAYHAIPGANGYNYSAKAINEMTQATKDNIRAETEEMSEMLARLDKESSEFAQKRWQAIDQVGQHVQNATGANEEEILAFKKRYAESLDEATESARTFFAETDQLIRENDLYNGNAKVEVNTEFASMSFADLDQKIKANQTEIDTLNAKIINPQTDTNQVDDLKKRLQECIGLQAQLNGAIQTKTENLNTDSGIQERIKQLREMISTEQYGSDQRKKHIKELQQLQSKLQQNSPTQSKGGGNKASQQDQNNNQLEEKQLEAQRKLEEARISVMEEGYAKRKATLDLQHQRELDRIAKEEKELEKARKKANPKSGGLTDEEKRNFEERRKLANQAYDSESIKLFDGEIEYKKRQYEAYFSWVRNVGADVANTHFKDLLANGSSFITWVNSQIAQLEAKRSAQPNDFTAGDANALNALRSQLNELTGQKSDMDLFKESLTQSIRQAQTLAQKLQAVAEMKDRLARGDFHLNTDDSAAANLALNQQESELNEQVTEEVLNNYKTFEEKKLEITQQYQILRNEAEKLGFSDRVAMINQGEAEALSALNAQMLMQTESWKNLFADLDSLTVEEIEKLIKDIQQKMSTADLKLNPADMKAVLDKLDEAKKKVLDTNPFKALGSALSEVFKKQQDGSKKTSKQIKTDWKNLGDATKACFDFVDDAISSCSVLGDLIGENGKATLDMVSGITQAGIAMAAAIKTAETASVVLAAISIALQGIQWIASLFNNDDEIEEHIQATQRDIDALDSSLKRLQNAYDHTYWVFNDEEEAAYRKRVSAIQDQIKALEAEAELASKMWNFSKYAELTKQIKDLRYELEKAERTGDMFDLMQLQTENLRKQQQMIREQIEAEKDKKDTDWDKISQWEEKIKDIDTQIQDMERSMMETLAGTDVKSAIDEFADALVEAYDQGLDRAEALGKKTKEVLKNAVVEALKRQFLAKGINDAVEYLGGAMQDSILTDQERAHFEVLVNQAGHLFNNALDGIGDWIKNAEEQTKDPLTGAVQGMSEETGGLVAGRMNAVVINQSEMLDVMRQQLQYQAEIAYNTSFCKRLDDIATDLRSLKNSGNPLLSQGIS